MGLGAASEVVTLDVAGETPALRDTGHVDLVTRAEQVLDGQRLADLVVVHVVDPELAQRLERLTAGAPDTGDVWADLRGICAVFVRWGPHDALRVCLCLTLNL